MIIPVIAVSLASYFGLKAYKKKKAFTPERRSIYETAMNSPMDPQKLRDLAAAFEKEGLSAQALMLQKRAALREAPESVKAQRRTVFKQAMSSTNPVGIQAVAKAHEELGATGAAQALYLQAETLKAVKNA